MRAAIQKYRPRWLRAYAITRVLLIFVLVQAFADVVPQVAGGAAASPSDTENQSPLVGLWVTQDNDWVVQISPCNGQFCGQLIVLSKSRRPDFMRLDAKNPNPAERNRPLCGLELLGGFTPSDGQPGKWKGGWVYDPENGKTYSSHMWLDGPNTLKVRGYILTTLLGRNETLKRETHPIKHCSASPAG
jgi:uncharacterized protein (DUF2147 family)